MDNETQQLSLDQVHDELKKAVRRIDELQKTVDLLYKDREILEDIQGSIRALQATTLSSREHHDNTMQSLKTDIKDSQFQLEEKLDSKTVIIKSEKENIIDKIIKKLKGVRE